MSLAHDPEDAEAVDALPDLELDEARDAVLVDAAVPIERGDGDRNHAGQGWGHGTLLGYYTPERRRPGSPRPVSSRERRG